MNTLINESANNYVFYRLDINNISYYFVEPRNSRGYTDYILISNDGKDISESENITACKFKKVLWKKYINNEGQNDPSLYLKVQSMDRVMRYSTSFASSWSIPELIEDFKQFFIIKELPNLKSIYQYLKFEMRIPEALIHYYFKFDTSMVENELENVQIGQSKILFPDSIKEKNKKTDNSFFNSLFDDCYINYFYL